jgi:alpha-beta hydrolase superfamily lysophospholipase
LLKSVNGKRWFGSMPYQFPILLVAGSEDPVAGYGKGAKLVAKRLREAGCNRVQCHVYPGMRHEILLEPGHGQVYETVIEWLDKAVSAVAKETAL